jgi:hypothetical protein
MRWCGGVLKPPDQERKKLLQRPASLEIRRNQELPPKKGQGGSSQTEILSDEFDLHSPG